MKVYIADMPKFGVVSITDPVEGDKIVLNYDEALELVADLSRMVLEAKDRRDAQEQD